MKKESLFNRFWEMIEHVIISRTTIDLMKINEITDRLLRNVEERDKSELSMRLLEYQLLQTSSKHGEDSRAYMCRLCKALLEYTGRSK